MLNVIKMDVYRLFHTVSLYIMLIVTAMTTVFSIYMTKVDLDGMGGETEIVMGGLQVEENSVDLNIGFYGNTHAIWKNGDIPFADLVEMLFQSGFYLLFLSIFVSIFVYAEQKNGFIKNIAGQLSNRWMLVASKTVAAGLQVFLMFAVTGIATFITGKAFWGTKFTGSSFLDIAKVFGGQYLLHMGFVCLVLCMCIMFRSSALSMTVGILISSRMATLVYFGINMLIEAVTSIKDFDINRYTIENGVTEYALSVGGNDMVRLVAVALGYIVIGTFTASVFMQKRDIR